MLAVLVVMTLTLFGAVVAEMPKEIREKFEASKKATDAAIQTLWDRWQISDYPNFLRSAAISHTSWEVMKLKFQRKILRVALGRETEEDKTFIISFMGSSVTAGHDTAFNSSFPVLTGEFMKPAFEDLGIELITRNAAMGNNPCEPYDICPQTFSGKDADMVHWEQSYNCFGHEDKRKAMFEQFVRQCVHMPRQPIVVFSDSATPNWPEKDCEPKRKHHHHHKKHRRYIRRRLNENDNIHYNSSTYTDSDSDSKYPYSHSRSLKNDLSLSEGELKLLEMAKKGDFMNIAAQINAPTIPEQWGPQVKMFQAYQTLAGVQVWSHRHYEEYKCHGPYVKEWACCSASWHPSKLGHELRASHHSFFWLQVLKDALTELLQKSEQEHLEELLTSINKHISAETKHVPVEAMYQSEYSDRMQCYTTFEPIHDESGNLNSHILTSMDGKEAWTHQIFEDLTDKNILIKARERGYLDFKHMVHGNKDNSPLSLKIKIDSNEGGTFFLCEPPGNWGKMPDGFMPFWEVGTKVYITKDAELGEGGTQFTFDESKAKVLSYTNRLPKDTQNVCVDFAPYKLPSGTHVITVVPTTDDRIMISVVLLPQ